MTKKVLTPLVERIMARVVVTADGCWEFTGAKSLGYGVVGRGRRSEGTAQTHRVMYEHTVGPIPDGLQIDHLCRNRACCNPAHLEAVTQRENIMRGTSQSARNAAKTHCPQGHPYDETNTYFGRSGRMCRVCQRERARLHYKNRRAA